MSSDRPLGPRPGLTALSLLAALFTLQAPAAGAAVGCALSNPVDDLRRFFPEMTDFQTHYLTFALQNPDAYERLPALLHDALDPVYETADVPYTLYAAQRDGVPLGYVFGANQRGTYSNLQLIAVTDPDLDLQTVYFQKIRSPRWKDFASPEFTASLADAEFDDFPTWHGCYSGGRCDAVPIQDPTDGEEAADYRHILRGVAKLRVVADLVLHPGAVVRPRDRAALAERVSTWWSGEPTALPLDDPTMVPVGAVGDGLAATARVFVWPAGRGIYPLADLTRHPLVFDRGTEPPATVTWSVTSGTAALLAVDGGPPSRSAFRVTDDTTFGVRLVADRRTRSQWSPALGQVLRGPPGALDGKVRRVAGGLLMSWRQARRLLPDGRVLRSAAAPAEVAAQWQRAVTRYVDPGAAERVLAVFATDGAALALSSPSTDGVREVTLGGERVAVVRADGVASGFVAPPDTALRLATRDPWTGAPWLWDARSGALWDAWTGAARNDAAKAPLRPALTLFMSRAAFHGLFPAAALYEGG